MRWKTWPMSSRRRNTAGAIPASICITTSRTVSAFPGRRSPLTRKRGSSSASCGPRSASIIAATIWYTAEVIHALPAAATAAMERLASPVPRKINVGAMLVPLRALERRALYDDGFELYERSLSLYRNPRPGET